MSDTETQVGDCFPKAVELMWQTPGAIIVHGIVSHPAVPEHWHAWIEVDGMCIDKANGLDVMLPQDLYYRLGNIETTYKFNRHSAAMQMAQRDHYGPWVDDFESMCEL